MIIAFSLVSRQWNEASGDKALPKSYQHYYPFQILIASSVFRQDANHLGLSYAAYMEPRLDLARLFYSDIIYLPHVAKPVTRFLATFVPLHHLIIHVQLPDLKNWEANRLKHFFTATQPSKPSTSLTMASNLTSIVITFPTSSPTR